MQEFKHFINGVYIGSQSGKTFENRSPVDNSLIGLVHEAGREEVDAAVAAARAALSGPWGKLTQAARIELLNKVAARINERFDEFLEAECRDTGKPRKMAAHIDIPRGAANFKAFSETLANHPTEAFRLDTPDGAGALNIGQRTPKGVIAVISPWNLPLLLMTWKVGPALACGNTVVVKPSEETPATTTLLGDVADLAASGSWLGCDVINSDVLTSPFTRGWVEMQAQAGAAWQGVLDDPVGFLGGRGWSVTLTQAGQPDANYGRWTLPVIPTTMPNMPHNWFVTARKGDG